MGRVPREVINDHRSVIREGPNCTIPKGGLQPSKEGVDNHNKKQRREGAALPNPRLTLKTIVVLAFKTKCVGVIDVEGFHGINNISRNT